MIKSLINMGKPLIIKQKYLFANFDLAQYNYKRWNFKHSQQQKAMIKKNKFGPQFAVHDANFQDGLYMPGLDRQQLISLQIQTITKGEISLSNTFVAILMYHLVKNRLIVKDMMKIIDSWLPRHKGQYSARQTFGCLYASIIMNRQDLIDFFIDQMEASQLKFNLQESLELVEALNLNKSMTLQEKHAFWAKHFRSYFVKGMSKIKSGNIQFIFRVFDAFRAFQYFDQKIWQKIFSLMDKKKGWLRVHLIERLYPLSGTFPKAKQLFDKYYEQMSTNRNMLWRYNFDQLRLYSSQQMIAKSQQDVQMNPSFRTLLPKHKLDDYITKYQIFLQKGSVKQEEEIIRDKSQAFAYAIKDRFTAMAKDGIDFSKLTKKQFEQLFGEYNEELMKQKQQQVAGEQSQQEQQENQTNK